MSNTALKSKLQRTRRTRAKIHGTTERPRLSVTISNRNIVAQLINDNDGQTLAYISTVGVKEAGTQLTAKAKWAGEQIADLAIKKKIKSVVFDRGSRIYHGRLHALAEAARAKGLEF